MIFYDICWVMESNQAGFFDRLVHPECLSQEPPCSPLFQESYKVSRNGIYSGDRWEMESLSSLSWVPLVPRTSFLVMGRCENQHLLPFVDMWFHSLRLMASGLT